MGKLIVIEGLDSCGKSTQVKLISEYLESKNLKTKFIHFPKYGHNEFSLLIEKFLRGEFGDNNKVDPYFVANIFAMDRFKYLKELKNDLDQNDVVILDRYVFSNIAFQAAKYYKPENISKAHEISEWIKEFEFNFLELPYPDLTLFLDTPIDIIKERLSSKRIGEDREYLKGKEDIHEIDMSYQSRARDNYLILHLQEEKDYTIVECGNNKPNEVFDKYKTIIEEKL